jgi:hypothetical protein
LSEGLHQAKTAQNVHDYERTLNAYVNGFRDGHTWHQAALEPSFMEWPGFLPAVSADGAVRVGVSEVPNLTAGDQLVSCDGMSADRLFETRVAPYLWNRDIASERGLRSKRPVSTAGATRALSAPRSGCLAGLGGR